ncbi:MAG TPA: PEGA domain-containing protein [Bryobacteraceae bacterium]|jgi:hypothetical protein
MKRLFAAGLLLASMPSFAGKDKSNDYQVGTYVSAVAVDDGTITSTIRGDATTVAGGVFANHVVIYKIKVADGTWSVETMRQALDSSMRNLGTTPAHFKSEKPNPLDGLKSGDKVIFRLEKHKKLVGGVETDMYIPFADKPDKEVEFVTTFEPDVAPTQLPTKPSDNVKAMCDSGRLSPELHKRFCEAAKEPEESRAVASSELVNPTKATPALSELVTNSEAAKSSPAAAASLANVGRTYTPQELTELVQKGQASRFAVVTAPPGAEVEIDGKRAGVTPFAGVLLKQGDTQRTITIKMSGYKTVERGVVPDGKTIPIGLTLERQ